MSSWIITHLIFLNLVLDLKINLTIFPPALTLMILLPAVQLVDLLTTQVDREVCGPVVSEVCNDVPKQQCANVQDQVSQYNLFDQLVMMTFDLC